MAGAAWPERFEPCSATESAIQKGAIRRGVRAESECTAASRRWKNPVWAVRCASSAVINRGCVPEVHGDLHIFGWEHDVSNHDA